MIRLATLADVEAMHVVRMSVRENRLSNPASVQHADYAEMLAKHGRGWVWEEGGAIVAFGVADHTRRNIWALFVAPGNEGRGYGRAIHDAMVAWLFAQGSGTLWLTTTPDTRAARFYRAAGWGEAGTERGELRFELDDPSS